MSDTSSSPNPLNKDDDDNDPVADRGGEDDSSDEDAGEEDSTCCKIRRAPKRIGNKGEKMELKTKREECNNRKCTKTLSKAPCLVALNMYLTLHLLLFG